MTPAAKASLLAAYDALVAVATSYAPPPSHHSHGGSAGCGYCEDLLASGRHNARCPINVAMAALLPLLPDFYDRPAWLADPAKPAPLDPLPPAG